MPNFPWRPGGNVPPVGDAALDELLATGQPPPDAAPGLLHVAEVLTALQAGPSGSELAGKTRAMVGFRDTFGTPHRPRRLLPRRPGVLRGRISAKIAATAAAVAVAAAAAAYVGALPAPLQKVAHDVFAAPAAHAGASRAGASRAGGVGLAATGRTAFSLCTAYWRASARGDAPGRAMAFRHLAKAAGGAANVSAFCASVSHPGVPASKPGAAARHLGVHPSARPGDERSAHPRGDRPGDPAGKRHVRPRGDRPWPPAGHRPWPPAGNRPGHPAGNRPGHPAGDRAARSHDLSPREAVCGSAPGAQRPSHVHPPALSGQSRGC